MTNYEEKYYLEKCKEQIEKHLGIGESITWKQRDFEYLCEQVFLATNITISLSTIKRIWNAEFKVIPQPATLNALAAFLGYTNWNNFKKSLAVPDEVKLQNGWSDLLRKRFLKILAFSTFFLICILILGFVFFRNNQVASSIDDINAVKFSFRKTDTKQPNSVVFYYDVTSISPSKVSIQQSWDKKMTIEADPTGHYRTCIYYYPGFFKAKLIADGRIVKEANLILNTTDWVPMLVHHIFDSIPRYITKSDFTHKTEVYLSPDDLKKGGISLPSDYYLLYSYCSDFNKFSSDNFIFETKIKNNLDQGALLCQTSYVYLSCENGWINIPLSSKGCVSDIKLNCSEKYIDGKSNDLSAFGCDMNEWHSLRLENINRSLSIFIDDSLVYKIAYKTDLGNIYEIAHVFRGCGRFKDVVLKKPNGEIAFKFPYIH